MKPPAEMSEDEGKDLAKPCVLIVEDSATQALSLQILLEREGYRTVTTRDGREGLRAAAEIRPDVVVSDVKMPVMNGFEMCAALKRDQATRSTPVLLLTSLNDPTDIIEGLKAGADSYVTKPYEDALLLDRLDQVMAAGHQGPGDETAKTARVTFEGQEYSVKAGPSHVLDLLLRTYQDAVDQNRRLIRTQDQLRALNGRLQTALAELEQAQQTTIREERLHAIGTMASGIVHDVNNALMPAQGFSELLLAYPEVLADAPKAERYLTMINTAARDAAGTVDRLRDFYRDRGGNEEFDTVDLRQVVEQVISLTRPKWKAEAEARGVAIEIETDLKDASDVSGNESELRQAFANLVFNAVDAMPEGGVITFRTWTEDGWTVLEVRDTGVGMTEETRKRCLEPFFTTKGPDAGTGMGLAAVYGIIRRHEGRLDIEAEEGRGAAFTIRFPAQALFKELETVRLAKVASRTFHFLLVDDDHAARDMLGEYLAHEGHTFEAFGDSREGLQAFREKTFDIVVTDRAMPGMRGDELAAAVKEARPNTPVIMLTGFGRMMQAADDKPEHVDIVLGKPVAVKEFFSAVAALTQPARPAQLPDGEAR